PARRVIFAMDRKGVLLPLGARIMLEVQGDDVLRFGDPVGIVETVYEFVHYARLVAQQRSHDLLLFRHPLLAPGALVPQPQGLFRGNVELGEELALPAVPDTRPDRADIDDGQ